MLVLVTVRVFVFNIVVVGLSDEAAKELVDERVVEESLRRSMLVDEGVAEETEKRLTLVGPFDELEVKSEEAA